MPAHIYKCFNCDAMFVCGRDVPENFSCAMQRCDIREISEEEAAEAVEEMRENDE